MTAPGRPEGQMGEPICEANWGYRLSLTQAIQLGTIGPCWEREYLSVSLPCPCNGSATLLVSGKGLVLAMLAAHAPARGSGPGKPPLPSTAPRGVL